MEKGKRILFHMRSGTVERLAAKQDRILYGSDFPNLIFRRESEIDQLPYFNLSDEFYRKVFRDNGLGLIEKTIS